MKIALFGAKSYDQSSIKSGGNAEFEYLKEDLSAESAGRLTSGKYEGVCIFVNDKADEACINVLKEKGIKFILIRAAGFNNVDLKAAKTAGIKVFRVPAYSPNAVAEFAVGLMLALNRKIHKSYNRTRENNFALDGLLGFDFNGKTVGVIGTGAIGVIVCRIMKAFGCRIIAYDIYKNEKAQQEIGFEYVDLDTVWKESDVISIHAPLTKETTHMLNDDSVAKLKDGVMIVNTSRGPLIDTKALIRGLKTKKIGSVGMDVYENESNLFFEDHSKDVMEDDMMARLTSFNNVIVTGHQAFFTKEALGNISKTTMQNIDDFTNGKDTNEMTKTVKD
eukprot:TRINITY_DN1237_c0_g1_i2.p1 TRINITY_DN1237_c0_g1~~TRINITY_DN1237_c0_g1_i2.p1  ORF type:complete len:334 (-),score=125.03 TRINITY_DN1237_c0_g1_i2:24-1025(-)